MGDNIQKYFYLICFCAYLRDQSSSAQSTADEEQKKNFALTGGKVSTPTENLKISKKFVDWMNEKSNLRTICEEGRGKLQWERYSSRCFGQLAKLGQHRLQKEPRQNHSRYLPD